MISRGWYGIALSTALALAGCLARQTQITQSVCQPGEAGAPLGRVALFTLISPKSKRFSHEKDAGRFRQALQAELENTPGTHVVLARHVSKDLAPEDSPDRIAAALPFCREEARQAGADVLCLVHSRDAEACLTLGLGLPKTPFLRGECAFDLVVVDVASGRTRLAATGHWCDRVDLVLLPQPPSASTLAEGVAETLRSPAADPPNEGVASSSQQELSSSRR